jgi:dipeptidyl aminopeptidase/acylaminoacyl peptidase
MAYIQQGYVIVETLATGNYHRWEIAEFPDKVALDMEFLSWSPDGTRLLGSRKSTNSQGPKLWMLDTSTKELFPFTVNTSHTFGNPRWAPDSQSVVVAEFTRKDAGQFIQLAMNSVPRILEPFGMAGDPALFSSVFSIGTHLRPAYTLDPALSVVSPGCVAGTDLRFTTSSGRSLTIPVSDSLADEDLLSDTAVFKTYYRWLSDGKTLFVAVQISNGAFTRVRMGHYDTATSQLTLSQTVDGATSQNLEILVEGPCVAVWLDNRRLAVYSTDVPDTVKDLVFDEPCLYASWTGTTLLTVTSRNAYSLDCIPSRLTSLSGRTNVPFFTCPVNVSISNPIALSPDHRYLMLPVNSIEDTAILSTTLHLIDLQIITGAR